jgi:uncharacterized membrane protein
MKQHRLDLAVLWVVATGVCAYISFALPGDRGIAVRVYILVLGALGMVAVLSAVGAALPRRRRSQFVQALDEHSEGPKRVTDLARMEREVTLSVGNAYDLHTRLVPHLREIARARLERSGKQPGPDTLGRWWELLRPDRPEPADRYARGIAEADLRALVADLERM